jgi:hypothetical protein
VPRFDGTGPRGAGPMTGRGQGYCILQLSDEDRPARGYAGLQGTPVRLDAPAARPGRSMPAAMRPGRLARRGRRRRWPRWWSRM